MYTYTKLIIDKVDNISYTNIAINFTLSILAALYIWGYLYIYIIFIIIIHTLFPLIRILISPFLYN